VLKGREGHDQPGGIARLEHLEVAHDRHNLRPDAGPLGARTQPLDRTVEQIDGDDMRPLVEAPGDRDRVASDTSSQVVGDHGTPAPHQAQARGDQRVRPRKPRTGLADLDPRIQLTVIANRLAAGSLEGSDRRVDRAPVARRSVHGLPTPPGALSQVSATQWTLATDRPTRRPGRDHQPVPCAQRPRTIEAHGTHHAPGPNPSDCPDMPHAGRSSRRLEHMSGRTCEASDRSGADDARPRS
jgi:hypothetical protein